MIVVSTRAFDPHAFDSWGTVVLDQVDSLARSYRDRAAVLDGIVPTIGYRTLAVVHGRHERRLPALPVRRVAAGWRDAHALEAEWIPNLVDLALEPIVNAEPDRDLLFVGTLHYAPNIDAVERLARLWPHLSAQRPGISAIIAGSSPTERVVRLCSTHGWDLVADFPSLETVARRARLAVAPLTRVAGIQNKVLDAASLGIPQVVSAQALEGFAPGLPLAGHDDDESFVADVVRLLNDPATAIAEAEALRHQVNEQYGPGAWLPWANEVVASGPAGA